MNGQGIADSGHEKHKPPTIKALGSYKFASNFSNTRGWVYWDIHGRGRGGGRLYMDDILG